MKTVTNRNASALSKTAWAGVQAPAVAPPDPAPAAVVPGVAFDAGANTSLAEGGTLTRTIAFTDGNDDGAAGWSYSINYGDGTPAVNGNTPVRSLTLNHLFADGGAARTVTVTITDVKGDSASDSFVVSVANVAPTAPVSGAASVGEGAVFTLSVGAVVDPGTDTRSAYTVAWGDGAVDSFTKVKWNQAGGVFRHTYADGAASGTPQTVTVSATDEDGSFVLGTWTVVVLNVAPVAPLSGAAGVAEGSLYTLTVGAAADPGADTRSAYAIDWGDGSSTALTPAQFAAGSFGHVYADGAGGAGSTRTISVSATDEDGSFVIGTRAVAVTNVAPVASVVGAASVLEGSPWSLAVGGLADPGTDTPSAYAIDWGDGSSETFTPAQWAAAGGQFGHAYGDGAAAGTPRTATVSVTDEDGSFVLGSRTVSVLNAPPVVQAVGDVAVAEGAVYTLQIGGSDPAGAGDVLSYTIDWGDGGAPQLVAAAGAVTGVTHVYADGSAAGTPRTIGVMASDGEGGTASASLALAVLDTAPTAVLGGAATVPEGEVYALLVGAVADPGLDTRTGYTIDWGDGSIATLTPAQWAAAGGSFGHVYADGGSGGTARTVSVFATDEDGTHQLGSRGVVVTNAAPTVSLSGASASAEGSVYTLEIACSDPAGGDDAVLVAIDWGDGTMSGQELLPPGTYSHVFADDDNGPGNSSPRTIFVVAYDDDGGVATALRSVTVSNVAPTLALSGAAQAEVGVPWALDLGGVTDPGDDDVSAWIVNWGDGSSEWVGAAGTLTHVYTAAGTATVSVDLVDDDGAHAAAGTLALSVLEPAPAPAGLVGTNPLGPVPA